MPEVLSRADPVSENTVWYSGEEYQTKTEDSVSVSVAFENEINGTMTFYMVVGNSGTDTILVAPEQFYMYGPYQKVREVWNHRLNYTIYDTTKGIDTVTAIDPKSRLAGINSQMAQANATYATNSGYNAAAALLNLVGDVATIGQQKTEEQRREERDRDHSLKESVEQNQVNYQSAVDRLNSERDYWQNATLRKTTLFPSTAVGGRVCFPVDLGLRLFKLMVPIGPTIIEFDFKQKPIANQ